MIDYLPCAANVLAVRVAGTLSGDELDAVAGKMEATLAANEKTHVFVEVADLSGVDLSAMAHYLPRAARMLGKLDRFGRIAVVSGHTWVRWATRVESALLPGVSYEVFGPEDRDRALDWVEGRIALPHAPALKDIETDRRDILAFELDGRPGADEMHAVVARISRLLDDCPGKIRVLARFKQFGFPDMRGIDADYLRMKLRALERVERYAVVGGPAWLAGLMQAVAPILRLETRHFPTERENEAWDWVGARPTPEASLNLEPQKAEG